MDILIEVVKRDKAKKEREEASAARTRNPSPVLLIRSESQGPSTNMPWRDSDPDYIKRGCLAWSWTKIQAYCKNTLHVKTSRRNVFASRVLLVRTAHISDNNI